MGANLIESNINISHKEKVLGSGELVEKKIKIPSSDTTTVKVRCKLKLSQLEAFMSHYSNDKTATFQLRGTSIVDSNFGDFSIKINDSVVIDIEKLIRKQINFYFKEKQAIKISSIKTDFSSTHLKSKMYIDASWKNPLKIDYQIVKQNFKVFNKNTGQYFGSWKSNDALEVKQSETVSSTIEMELKSMSSMLGSGFSMLLNGSITLQLYGNITLKINDSYFEVPITTDRKVKIKDFFNGKM